MADDFSSTGAFNVNGQFATSVRYEATLEEGRVAHVQVRFASGRTELARASLTAEQARELLGERNFAAIEQAATKAPPPDPDRPPAPVRGELRGRSLDYRQVLLPEYQAASTENAIYLDSRARAAPAAQDAPARHQPDDRLAARDAAAGGAHAVQATGAAGAAIRTGARLGGAADAAEVAADVAHGEDTRPSAAATVAASTIVGAQPGSVGVQGAAKALQALGAAETAVRTARTVNESAQPPSDPPDPASAVDAEEQARLRRLRAAAVPQAVAERFLKVEDRYYFPDRTLAFTDGGTRLKAESHHVEVVRSLVAIAQARDWQALGVTGTATFRREVWREASLRGIEVRGYAPTELERKELRRAIEKRHGPDEVSREAPQRAPAQAARDPAPAAPRTPAAAAAAAADQHGRDDGHEPPALRDGIRAGITVGVLLEHGAAPYQFDQDNDRSYYVRLRTDRGEQTLWGVDLQRALAESKTAVQAGDMVGVENLGSRPVTITVRRRDANGREVAEEVDTHRNTWTVEKKDHFRQQAAKADALRHSDRASRQQLVDRHPDLAYAAVSLWLGEQVAGRKIERPQDRERFVAALQERLAQAVERGEPLHAPALRQEVAAMVAADRTTARTAPRDAAPACTDARAAAGRTTQPPRVRTPEAPHHAR